MKHLFPVVIFLTIVLANTSVYAQKIIDGYVYDAEKNAPLSGVTILGKNTARSVKSDYKGNYRLIIPEKVDILVFNLPGYAKKEVNIKGVTHINVSLRSYSSQQTENLVVIGSRNQTRTKGETYVAVDIIPIKEIINESGYVELTQILHYFAPSFNANRQSGADLADHIDPVSLRGLGPDQILFLINGKRYVNSAIINVFGTRGRGDVNTDINAIPSSAIERIEVLRDGAAAQYGSDAIAGVVNIVLKSETTGTSGAISYGTNATGWGKSLNYDSYGKIIPKQIDGGSINANITHNLQIDKGNFTVTVDIFKKNHTYRPNNTTLFPNENYREKFGDNQQHSTSIYWNGVYPFKKLEYYTFGGYQYRETESYIWTISPEDSMRNVYQIYPNGYNPKLLSELHNIHQTSGIRFKLGGWNNDLSVSFGVNYVDIHTRNTLNPSLLLKSKTTFHNGSYKNEQSLINYEVNKKFTNILRGLNVAFGAEYRGNYYKIAAGEDASWKNYMPQPLIIPLTNGQKDTIRKLGTSQGYPGISPHDALRENRQNISFYGDIELDISKKWLVAGALRYEKYRDFDGTLGGKLASRYKITPQLTTRISVQTGYRVPSLAQVFFQSTINDVAEDGSNFEKIIANNKSVLAQKLGIPHLRAEKSLNTGLGFSYNLNEKWTFSLDGYMINVKDRIILSNIFGQDNEYIGKDLEARNVKQAQFYINALNTQTTGLDINTAYKTNIGKAKINMSLGGNFNKMDNLLLENSSQLRGAQINNYHERELQFILQAAPKMKFHYNFSYQQGKIGVNLNLTYFSKVEVVPYSKDKLPLSTYQPLMVTDVSFNIKFLKKNALIVGINNLFDVYPSIQKPSLTEGGGHWESVQNGFNGAYIFSRLAIQF